MKLTKLVSLASMIVMIIAIIVIIGGVFPLTPSQAKGEDQGVGNDRGSGGDKGDRDNCECEDEGHIHFFERGLRNLGDEHRCKEKHQPCRKKIRIGVVGTVNVQNLPPPLTGGRTEADDVEGGPHIIEPPGKPGPAMSPTGINPASTMGPSSSLAPSLMAPDVADPVLMNPIDFVGLAESGSLAPPDTQIAAGNTRLLEMVNVAGAFYGKLFSNQIKTFDLGSFFLTTAGQGTDPRVIFDAETHTYFAAYELRTPGGDDIRLAVAAEPGDNWTVYEVSGNNVDTCFDQPKLGLSTSAVTLSWNNYTNAKSCTSLPGKSFSGSEYIVIQKFGLLASLGSVPAVIWGPDSNRFQVVPTQSLSPSGVQYAAYHNNGASNFHVMTFTGVPGQSNVSFTDDSYGIGNVSSPPSAAQPSGGNANIVTNDDRLQSAVWQNDNLWGTFTESCTLSDATHACVRYVDVSTANGSVSQNIQLQDTGNDLYYGAVTLSGNGDLFSGMTISSSSLDPAALVIGVPSASFGPVTGGIIYQSGSQAYSSTNRWGDYSGVAADPNDPTVAWVGEEFGGVSNPAGTWGTAIAAVFFGNPPSGSQ